MKNFTLDWKGWWLLRPSMRATAGLDAGTSIYAIMGARLRKTAKGTVATAREPVLFNAHQGGALAEHLVAMGKTALGAFVFDRCKEIRKQPLVYAAALPDGTDPADLQAIVALIYTSLPFTPRRHGMPAPYKGEPVRITSAGRSFGLPSEITYGIERTVLDADLTRLSRAMAEAMARDAAATRAVRPDGKGTGGLATDRVPHPQQMIDTEKVPKAEAMIDTEKVAKDSVGAGVSTERVDRPSGPVEDTEFVPRPPARK